MISKRLIALLEIRMGKLLKSIRFRDAAETTDPVATATTLYESGIDELIFYDNSPSSDSRDTMIKMVEMVRSKACIPLGVGTAIRTIDDISSLFGAGVQKVYVDTIAILNPSIISEASQRFGCHSVSLSMDIRKMHKSLTIPSGYEVIFKSSKMPIRFDAVQWATKCQELGAGEVIINSMDMTVKKGFDIPLISLISDAVTIPVIAGGGGLKEQHYLDVFTTGKADGAMVSPALYSDDHSIGELKAVLKDNGVKVRLNMLQGV
ncbi:MAG: hypothetical protein JW795_04165 [Chitinivibrionales bacterium]|nr:hypothetical protein [Chitinivibrionales bacterium]